MAVHYGGFDITAATTAAAIVQFAIVKQGSTGTLCATTTSEGGIYGIAQEAQGATAGNITVRISGVSKVTYGGTVAIGDLLTAGAAGVAVATSTAGQFIVGQAIVAGSSGDIGTCIVRPGVAG